MTVGPVLTWDQGKVACNHSSFRIILHKKGMGLRYVEVERKLGWVWPGQGNWAERGSESKRGEGTSHRRPKKIL